MIKAKINPQWILWYENIGFIAIILLLWMKELFNLTHYFSSETGQVDWHESAVETALVLAVWVPVHIVTRKLLARLHYLESFLRICAWCRKINRDGHWLTLEQYFSEGLDIKTSHGICPECMAKQFENDANGSPS